MKRKMILGLLPSLLLLAALAIGGCGSDSNVTAAEEAGFKNRDASNAPQIPADAMKRAGEVKSSLDKSGPGNVKPPTSGPG